MTTERDRISSRQLGLITLAQLRTLKLAARQVQWEVATENLVPIRARVYRERGVAVSWEQSVLAAALSAGEGFVVSHTTAAVLWNLRHSDKEQAGVHISGERQVRIEGVTAHRVGLT